MPIVLEFAMLVVLSAACSPPDDAGTSGDPPSKPRSTVAEPAVSLAVKQRSTTPLPGDLGGLSLTAADITRGQVLAALIGESKAPLLGPLSMKQGDAARFEFGGKQYSLTLAKLNNSLIGDDVATFVIAPWSKSLLTESEKIERLIQDVETMTDAVFVRNGTEYPAVDAAKHLRRKRDAVKEEVDTAARFIDLVASKSSTTGEHYRIRLASGRTISAAKFLHDRLAKLEGEKEPTIENEAAGGRAVVAEPAPSVR